MKLAELIDHYTEIIYIKYQIQFYAVHLKKNPFDPKN